MNKPINAVLIIWICVTAGIITVIMAAVSLTEPLCKPCSYSPHFKGNLMPISSIIVAFLWRSDWIWTHSRFFSLDYLIFAVEVCVRKPLMPIHLSSEQVALEMLCLCGQLDLLIRAQVHQVRHLHWCSDLWTLNIAYLCVCLIQVSNLN